jgi:hypothetical protein
MHEEEIKKQEEMKAAAKQKLKMMEQVKIKLGGLAKVKDLNSKDER